MEAERVSLRGSVMVDGEKGKINLEMAEALDEMDKNLSSANADFLNEVLKKLKADDDLSDEEQTRLEALYKRYFGDEDESEEEADIDEDDFV
jgi:ABC-type amino acid transport substrate-binding protein